MLTLNYLLRLRNPFVSGVFSLQKYLGTDVKLLLASLCLAKQGSRPRCLFSLALISLFAALCCTFSRFSKNLLKAQKQHCICGSQRLEILGCCSLQHHQRELAAPHTLTNSSTFAKGIHPQPRWVKIKLRLIKRQKPPNQLDSALLLLRGDFGSLSVEEHNSLVLPVAALGCY